MPELDAELLASVMNFYTLKIAFHARGAANASIRAHITTFIRVFDKCAFEYDQSRANLRAYVESRNQTRLLFRSVGHLENCVNSANRCLRHLARLRSLDLDDPARKRILINAVQSTTKSIRSVRNAIEHMDRMISSSDVSSGLPIALLIDENGCGASIGTERIDFLELATALRSLHEFAIVLCDFAG